MYLCADNDFVEILIQLGLVMMFSSVFPLAAFCALVNNIVELRTDLFKLDEMFQRPHARAASGIGNWLWCIEFLGAVRNASKICACCKRT